MICFLLIASLGACGGGGGGATSGSTGGSTTGGGGGGGGDPGPPPPPPPPPPPTDPLNIVSAAERDAYFNVMFPDFQGTIAAATVGGPTAMASLPATMGTTSYSGYLNLTFGNATTSANIIGNAVVGVQFDTGTLSGTADGFLGVTPDQNMVNQVVSYEGTINLTNGDIFAGVAGASFDMEVDGALDNGLNNFVVDGELVGLFFGAAGEGLRGSGSSIGLSGDMDVMIDGSPSLSASGLLVATQD